MNGITYFKLTSPYDGDITKNCGLTGSEIDNNFYVLEGRDIKEVTLEGSALKVILYNGEIKYADLSSLTDSSVKNLSFDFDHENGVLKICQNGIMQEIAGFVTSYQNNNVVTTNETLSGNGKPTSPLGVSRAYMTGQFKPVNAIWDTETQGELPKSPGFGDRYIVHSKVSDYGKLYTYDAVKRIACELASSSSPWRVPTKEDWDDMLNAMEPMADARNHGNTSPNVELGQFAGAYLKSDRGWKQGETGCCMTSMGCPCGKSTSMCNPTYCGDYTSCSMRCSCDVPDSGDYGFDAMPTGFIDDHQNCLGFGDMAPFWTATMFGNCTSAYMKRVEWNKNTVYQDVVPTGMYLGLRLVKDYTGDNYYGNETILDGTYYTVLMPSVKMGRRIWMMENFASLNGSYCSLDPCGGDKLTYTDRYYIAEWDGKKWVTSLFEDGDSVVVKLGDEPNVEYRLYGNELRAVNDIVADDVYEQLHEEISDLDGRVEALENAVLDEENGLVTVVGDGEKGLVKDVNDLKGTVGNEENGLVKDVIDLKGDVNDLKGTVGNEENGLVKDVINLKDDVNDLKGDVNNLKETVGDGENGLVKDVIDLKDDVNNLKGTVGDVESGLVKDVKDLKEATERLKNGEIVAGKFNSKTGILTLERDNEEMRNIEVQFSFNFGEI